MIFRKPIVEVIKARYSVRTYQSRPIEGTARERLTRFAASGQTGPFGNQSRFAVVAASQEDQQALKSLGTYGVIKDATAFLAGATHEQDHSLEDFGFLMERLILQATDLGLGTCWLGGTFTRSSFAARLSLQPGETLPAVASMGYAAERPRAMDSLMRLFPQSHKRLPWERLFFDGDFASPLAQQAAGEYAAPLEMVRLGPSASNRQPWRVLREGSTWHFYLRRSRAYGPSSFGSLWPVADLQRIDMGIALCHFELTATELGLPGRWQCAEPDIDKPDSLTEYTASWIG
jgi:nitroreductase